ncbi:MAG: hypothetical protein H7Z13_20160 [Ferruginibacter sp.]|nr:hypothetical protein [Ferruginibacter sp.]
MNTESMNALKQVREVINTVQIELNDPSLTKAEKSLLADALINLNKLEDVIINNFLQEMVDKINSSNGDLKKLIADMEASTVRIAQFSNTIKKISDTVGVLAEITAKAMSAGIL